MSYSQDNKLVITAISAAVAGAALAYTALKLSEKKQKLPEAATRARPSIIYDKEERASQNVLFPHNHEEKMRRRIAARVAVEEDNLTPRRSVTVRVPATSANVGPGCT
jgi:homoserine kinase